MKFVSKTNGERSIEFVFFFIGVLQPSNNGILLFPRVGWNSTILFLVLLKEIRTLANCFSYILQCMGSISPSSFFRQLSNYQSHVSALSTQQISSSFSSWMLREFNILSSLILGLFKGMGTHGECKISLCNLRIGKLLMMPPTSGAV